MAEIASQKDVVARRLAEWEPELQKLAEQQREAEEQAEAADHLDAVRELAMQRLFQIDNALAAGDEVPANDEGDEAVRIIEELAAEADASSAEEDPV